MRSQAIENCAKLMANAYKRGDNEAMDNLCVKLSILCDRKCDNASVIHELVNQRVELDQ